MEKKNSNKEVLIQLAKEFWIPMLGAVLWTSYVAYAGEVKQRTTAGLISAFATSFFFCAWLPSQINRVRKTIKTESGLKDIHGRLQVLLDNLDLKIKDVVGYITGGESYCYVSILRPIARDARLYSAMISHVGEHNMLGVRTKITDTDAQVGYAISVPAGGNFDMNRYWSYTKDYGVRDLRGRAAQLFEVILPSPVDGKILIRIDFENAGPTLIQLMELYELPSGELVTASIVKRMLSTGEDIVFRRIDERFPREELGELAWAFESPAT